MIELKFPRQKEYDEFQVQKENIAGILRRKRRVCQGSVFYSTLGFVGSTVFISKIQSFYHVIKVVELLIVSIIFYSF